VKVFSLYSLYPLYSFLLIFVKVFWVMAERSNGQIGSAETEGLTLLEKKTAYGVNSKPIAGQSGAYEITLYSIRDR
jgi:hypothetical protein